MKNNDEVGYPAPTVKNIKSL